MTDRFFIAPFDKSSGLRTDVRPFLIPDDAYAELTNAYVYRGRVRKRFGSRYTGLTQLNSRLAIQIGTTDGGGDFTGFVPLNAATVPIATPAIGQLFSVGAQVFTVNALGTPADLLSTGTAEVLFNTTTGSISIIGALALTPVYYYPALPVMGLATYEMQSGNIEPLIGFDTRMAYAYDGTNWVRLDGEITPGAAHWSGSNSQLFWTTTWSGVDPSDKVLFITNFNENEPNHMRTFYLNEWDNFAPQITSIAADNFMFSAQILVVFKNSLLAFNTWEGTTAPGTNYVNRCRYSAIGSPLATNAWNQDIPGQGNAIDCPTMESIVTVEFVKDRLIVFCERSTWELVYTGNVAYPFAFQQINTELGADSTFSIVPFDQVAIGIGNVGIHECTGSNVRRIDDEIPDQVFDINIQNAGAERVYGIRDYLVEMVYWAFPNNLEAATQVYPNQVLVYNYKTGTWSLNDDSITCFGYIQDITATGVNWTSDTVNWLSDVSWVSGSLTANQRQVVAGNQEGYVFIIDPDSPTNAGVLQITDMDSTANTVTITCVDHNLVQGDYLLFEGITAIATLGSFTLFNGLIFPVVTVIDPNTFTVIYSDSVGTILLSVYLGGGTLARVSKINILTKEYNFYASQGRNAYISKVDFMVDVTQAGQLTADFYVSTSDVSLTQAGSLNQSLLGTGVLDTFAYADIYAYEETATRVWHPVYFQADGEVVQINLSLTDTQMRNPEISLEQFQMHAMCFYATPTSRFQ